MRKNPNKKIKFGDSAFVIQKNFPHLKKSDIQACLEYAAYLSTEKAIPAWILRAIMKPVW